MDKNLVLSIKLGHDLLSKINAVRAHLRQMRESGVLVGREQQELFQTVGSLEKLTREFIRDREKQYERTGGTFYIR